MNGLFVVLVMRFYVVGVGYERIWFSTDQPDIPDTPRIKAWGSAMLRGVRELKLVQFLLGYDVFVVLVRRPSGDPWVLCIMFFMLFRSTPYPSRSIFRV